MSLERVKITYSTKILLTDSLIILYLPIIGSEAFALFCRLTCIDKNHVINLKDIARDICLAYDKFERYLKKLEALNLIRRFESANEIILFLNEALSFSNFLNNEAYCLILNRVIGDYELVLLKEKYLVLTNEYRDVSTNLDDEYNVKVKMNVLKTSSVRISSDLFDYGLFVDLFDSNEMPKSVLNNEEFKLKILEYCFVTGLDEKLMKQAIIDSIEINSTLKYEFILQQAKLLSKKEFGEDVSFHIPNVETDNLKLARLHTPSEVIAHFNYGVKPNKVELETINNLIINTKLPVEVVNVIIINTLIEKKGELPGINYLEKVAASLIRNRILTAESAFEYFSNLKEKAISKVKTKLVPSTYKEVVIKEESKLSKEESDEILEKMKKRFLK